MSKHAKKEATATEAVKHLGNLAAQFNNGVHQAQSAEKLLEALAKFIESQDAEKQQLQNDLESVLLWVDTVKKLLVRAVQLEASNKAGALGRAAAAKGNIDEAISILERVKDPAFAASRKKKPAAPPTP